MSDSILVGYATRSGSTKEIAEAVAETLRQGGAAVDIRPLKNVKTLEGYRSVVLGAPLYMFHWHKDALGFLNRHKDSLGAVTVAVFALGPFTNEEKDWQEVRRELTAELAKFPWLTPVAQTVFGGRFDPAALRFPMTLIPAMKKMPASDIRDWEAIRGWATSLAAKL
jgi:menaquinone-dependent protoporphyrinogen oxidase